MKTIKPRSKTKKNNNSTRFGRVKFTNKESVESAGPDLSQLRKPIDISVSSLLEVTRLLEIGGDEVKTMLSYECDVVYECRVCRSLFRSLANFISHKRVYCREQFNLALCRKNRNDHIISAGTSIPNPESAEDDNNMRILRSQVVRKSTKKDLTSVVDMLQRKRSEDINENVLERLSALGNSDPKTSSVTDSRYPRDKADARVRLEAIDSTNTAVYQTADAPAVHSADLMKAQMLELQNMVDRDTAVLNPDGRLIDGSPLEKSDSPLQIYASDDEEGANANANCTLDLVCSVCNAKFATRKTLTYHMKSLHVSYRTCYPCPCCSSTFANTWSVYRHLFKVHRKTNEQVRKLRPQIQEKAFRKETTGAEDIEKENAATKSSSGLELQASNSTQEWMEHFELDLELQRCGGCGRRFDRRAALLSHAQLCQKRIAACNEAASGNKSKRLSKTPSPKNVVEDNNPLLKETSERVVQSRAQSSKKKIPKKSDVRPNTESPITDVSEEVLPEIINNNELSIRVANVSRISDADWEMMGSNLSRSPSNGTPSPTSDISMGREQSLLRDQQSSLINVPDSPEIIFTSIDEARTVAISFGRKKRRVSLINNTKELAKIDKESSPKSKSPPSEKEELISPNHMAVMKDRIATIANLRKLQCLPCRKKFASMTNLRRHMAVHIGWHRYGCKLCDFKCFVKCDCVAHCNKFHDAKNNRAVIADMVVQIPPDQSTLAQEIMMDLSGSFTADSEPELIDVSELSPKTIECNDLNGVEDKQEKDNESNEEKEKEDDDKTDKEESSTTEEKPPEPSVEESSNQTQGRLDNDPDLRKMVMEVIFGTGESDAAGRSESAEIRRIPKSEAKVLEAEDSPVKINEGKRPGAVNQSSKSSRSCLSTSSNKLEEIKRRRPTRNRVKPVNEDFIYDLTELIRKESAIHRATAIATQKNLKKKQQQAILDSEANEETKSEGDGNDLQKLSTACKLPSLLSQKRRDSDGYGGKLSSLKQAEVRLINTSMGIISGKNMGATRISLSSQK